MESPVAIIAVFVASGYLFKLWLEDLNKQKAGTPNPKAFPGAFPARPVVLWIAALGAIALVLVETLGEYAIGVSEEQSSITVLFLLAMISAGFIEEFLFRGYVVIENRGKGILWMSIFGGSLVFALLHFQYYTTEDENGLFGYALMLTPKSGWSLFLLFLNSLWFYSLRFLPFNPNRSLLPCFIAHVSSNLGVFIVKYSTRPRDCLVLIIRL